MMTKRQEVKEEDIAGVRDEATAGRTIGDRQSKGLRHFAIKVRAKVEEKRVTTYNEVADELVMEFLSDCVPAESQDLGGKKKKSLREFDEKNIRRRVYDALNVLMAMNIIEKNKKEIRWRGLPKIEGREALKKLETSISRKQKAIGDKQARLTELKSQNEALRRLTKRNFQRSDDIDTRVYLPFIVVRTSASTAIDVEVDEGQEAVCFTFDGEFQMEDDQSVMRRLGFFNEDKLDEEHEQELRAQQLLFPSSPGLTSLMPQLDRSFLTPEPKGSSPYYAAGFLQSPDLLEITTKTR